MSFKSSTFTIQTNEILSNLITLFSYIKSNNLVLAQNYKTFNPFLDFNSQSASRIILIDCC